MKNIQKYGLFFPLLLLLCGSIQGQIMPVEVIHFSTTPSQATNIVIVGDGYTLEQQDKFIIDARKASIEMLNQLPWRNYRGSINVIAIKVVSEVTGASRDPNKLINNYFGSSYWSFNIERLLYAWHSSKVGNVLMSNAPFYDIGVIVVNDNKYGGSGGTFSAFSTHQSATEIMIHEIGHSFGRLSDEYWAGPQYARENSNMTQNTNPETVIWKRFLNRNEVGIYPHAESPTWHRPHQNCKMRFLGPPFCGVCSNELTVRLQNLSRVPPPTRPIAFFGADILEIEAGKTVNFFDFSSYAPTGWEWEFEGGTPKSSTDRYPRVTYKTAGNFNVTLKAKNANGENVLLRNDFITVLPGMGDNTPPTIKIKNIKVALDKNGIATVKPEDVDDGTFDDVALESLELSKTEFCCEDHGENVVVFKATDTSGNTASEKVIITVVDKILPTPKTKNITIQLDENGFASLKPKDVDDGSFDNCSIKSMSLSKTEFGIGDSGENKVIFTVIDVCGNSCEAEIIVTVEIFLSADSGNAELDNIKLYPNPANDLVVIEFLQSHDQMPQSLQILDLNGRLMKEVTQFEKTGKFIYLDVNGLPSGQYFVRFYNQTTVQVLRFVIEK